MVKNSGQPYCILRLGYLYGPQYQDLALYVKSFKLGRPYYSGPPEHLSNWVRFEDAAQAVELAAQRKPKGEVFNIVDGTPVSFGDFIDFFAVKQGRSRPVHLPMWGTPMFRLIIKHQQTELLKIITTVKNDKAKAKLGWEPAYPDYKKGITQIINLWRENKVVL
jgi:nucleoside-diphosphate-sugar epimerase